MAHLSRRRALPAALALLAVFAAPAAAKLSAESIPVLDAPLSAPAAVARTCSAKPLAPTAPGAVVKTIAAPMGGLLDARLHGSPAGADWDLAVFDALNGRLLNGSAAFGGNEVVQAAVTAGQLITVQACRRSGSAAPVALTVRDTVVSGVAPKSFPLRLVSIPFRSTRQVDRLAAAGIDLNETAHGRSIDAVLHRPSDATKIRRAGMSFTVKVADLVAFDRRFVRASLDPVSDLLPSKLPSGRATYRHLVDYQNDLKKLVEEHPGMVRPVVLPGKSVEGRTIEGIELATNLNRTDDGRPTHVELGLHHVREWPSGEVAIEYAFTLADGAGKDARVDGLLRDSRTFVMPVINPDGLEATQMAGDSIPVYDDNGYTSLPLAAIGAGPYRRKNCEPTQAGTEALPCVFKDGIDLNRNYGAFWGGPGSGASPGPTGQTYRGPSPFSEPETEAVHRWSSAHQVMVINSNHTYAGDFLYQPGFNAVDEPGLKKGTKVPYTDAMKGLADRMAKAAGYVSMVSYQLYDVTGATEDWNYFAQGAFGYTAEVSWEDFHPDYQDGVVDQYLGTVDGYMGQAAGRTPSKGLQESFLLAGEAAVDTANHAIIEGSAPAGATLTLTKDFTTATSYDASGRFQEIPEHLETTLTVPASGHYVWHVNPSTRPVPLIAHRTEAWTLSCGTESRQVVVAIGQRVTQDLAC
ncbi:MAG: cpt [Solirubrobacterales bacterium]|nr:cpt [Solirubrobacterales bacterium]